MKDSLAVTIIFICIIGVLIGWYAYIRVTDTQNLSFGKDPLNTTYTLEGEVVTLVGGKAEQRIAPDSSTRIYTRYFGNDFRTDLDGDGDEDVVFLITQDTGGTGAFYYVVAALQSDQGWIGSHSVFLGDRISPQNIQKSMNPSHEGVIVINYVDRAPNEPMSARPSIGKSLGLKLDPETMQFGEVLLDFEGEADPSTMSLNMHTWKWTKTTYNNQTESSPNKLDAFTITFYEDGTFSATTDCNAMSGTFEINEKTFTFGENIAMTKKYCEESQEQEFVVILSEIETYSFTGKGELVFDLESGGSVIFAGI